MSSYKMKSLLKGLRYISQVFESDKEPEMKIGHPTDVKHVAHIGSDGPSAAAPSWMNEFKSGPGFPSNNSIGGEEDDSSSKCLSESGRAMNLPKIPKSSKKSATGSPTKERSHHHKTKQRSSNKGGTDERARSSRRSSNKDGVQDEDSSWSRHSGTSSAGIPKKSKRKKSKESVGGGSSRSSRRSDIDTMSDYMSENGSVKSMTQRDDDERRPF